ncbi:MAG: thermonuclease family protein [Dehalococcoidia bacterium]
MRVIDGDTIQVEGGLTVHYIGINAPEMRGPDEPSECYGAEARERNRELVEGKVAQLERDMAHEDGDGQVLRYVYVDGRMLNEILLREGYARASVHPPDLRYADVLLAAQQEAGELSRGLWGACPASSSD